MSKAIQQNTPSFQSLPQSLPQLLTRAASHAGRKAENQDTLTMQTLVPTGRSEEHTSESSHAHISRMPSSA